jgi:hypothetical protein
MNKVQCKIVQYQSDNFQTKDANFQANSLQKPLVHIFDGVGQELELPQAKRNCLVDWAVMVHASINTMDTAGNATWEMLLLVLQNRLARMRHGHQPNSVESILLATCIVIENDIRSTFQDLESVFDILHAGTDEVVALAKVVFWSRRPGYCPTPPEATQAANVEYSSSSWLYHRIDWSVTRDFAKGQFQCGCKISSPVLQAETEKKWTLLELRPSPNSCHQLQMYEDLEDMFAVTIHPLKTCIFGVGLPACLAISAAIWRNVLFFTPWGQIQNLSNALSLTHAMPKAFAKSTT